MSILYIFFIPDHPLMVKLLFKLIPMWLIIYYAYRQFPYKKLLTHWIMLTGLFFCMLGDGLLHWFVIGLSAFLIGHLFYLAGFLSRWSFSKIRFVMILPIGIYASIMGKELISALSRDGSDSLIVPVLAYVTVISLMAWSAIMTGNKWAIIGSLLFVISDSILSWNMFISNISFSGPLIMTTYYTAQFLIAHSIGTVKIGNNSINQSGFVLK
ncbi:lysoplasmalogenase [Heyndrickxia sp. NPDC080065]|uniref:lysoplasmalogenase n=1 Tax=Heyndrickxia sp. NPDC080065 TaxID=3390568 RepID=UPI003D084FD9